MENILHEMVAILLERLNENEDCLYCVHRGNPIDCPLGVTDAHCINGLYEGVKKLAIKRLEKMRCA